MFETEIFLADNDDDGNEDEQEEPQIVSKCYKRQNDVDFIEEAEDEKLFDNDLEEDEDTSKYIEILDNEPSRSKSRNTRCEMVTARLHNFEASKRPDKLLEKIVTELLSRVTKEERTPPISIGLL